MADKNYHTFTVNGRFVSEKEYNQFAQVMDELTPSGTDLYWKKMAEADASHAEVINALRNIGKGKYVYNPDDPFKKAIGGPVRSKRRPMDGIAVSGLTKAPYRRT